MSSLALYKALTSAGADEQAARSAADDVADKGNLATRTDIAELKGEIAELRMELKGEIAELRMEVKSEIAELRMEVKSEIAELGTELKGDIGGIYRHMWSMAAGLVTTMVVLRLFDA